MAVTATFRLSQNPSTNRGLSAMARNHLKL
jgi:hypothetical protein